MNIQLLILVGTIAFCAYQSFTLGRYRRYIHKANNYIREQAMQDWCIRQAFAFRLKETLEHLREKPENLAVCDYIKEEMTKLKPMADLTQGFIQDVKSGKMEMK